MKSKEKEFCLDDELFEAILDVSYEAIWVRDFKLDMDYWLASGTNREKYGLPEKGIGDNFWEKNIHPEDREQVIGGYNNAIKNPSVKDYKHQYRFYGKDSVEYFIEDNIKFIRGKKGKAIRVTGVWRDLTESHRKEQQLNSSIEKLKNDRLRFKQITEVTNMAMWEINFETRNLVWFAGKRALEEFNLEKRGKLTDWENAIYSEDRDRVVVNFQKVMNDITSEYFDTYRVEKADGSLAHVIDQGKITRDKKGKPIRAYGGWIDITKEREREILLEKALEDQRELNRTLATRDHELTSTEE
jgi:PAS domain S-box-containing protein